MVKWLYSKNSNHHPKGENHGGQIKIAEKLYQVTLKKVKGEKETAKMGLVWMGHCLKDYGIDKIIDRYNLKKANKQIAVSKKIMAGVLSIIAGAERIEDIENLRADKELINNLGLKKIISPGANNLNLIDSESGKLKSWLLATCLLMAALKNFGW